jgi:eukaryotic-like serine/threonine-protein kinase
VVDDRATQSGGRLSEKRNENIEAKSEPKRRVGPFELERRLGVGGMGVVYLATYLKNGRLMAVKVLPPEMCSNQKLVRRFLREMSILSKLRHENIVRYYGGGKDKTQHFYAMEYMDGGSMELVLKKKGRLSWEETVDNSRQIAFALEYAHNHGIIHRDLKPANLFMGKDGRLKLGDFGIARDTQATALTAAGRTVGTYAYMAPEQISGKPPVSRKTDLYALGCVMFEMLTGKPPFVAPTAAEMLFAHLEQEPPRVSEQALDCPVWLENVVQKLLEKDPEERYFDALALQVALDEVVEKVTAAQSVAQQTVAGGGSGATVKDGATVREALTGKKKKKKKKKGPIYERAWFLGTCLAVVAAMITWFSWPLSDEALFAQAQKLMQSKEPGDWTKARDSYLDKLMKRPSFANSPHAAQARDYIDQVDMDIADRQATLDMRLNRTPRSQGEGLYMHATRFLQFNDRITALQEFRSMAVLLKDREEDRSYLNLARNKIREIEESGNQQGDVATLVNDNLKRADDLESKAQLLEAQNIWNGVITLYSDNKELQQQVKYARARLQGEKVERTVFGLPKPKSNESGPTKEKP